MFSAVFWLLEAIAAPRPWQPWRVLFRHLADDGKTALARACLQVVFVAYQAAQMIHAIVLTLVRLVMTHRKMLEWQTAATESRLAVVAATQSGLAMFVDQMIASPIAAGIALAIVVTVH